MPIDFYCPGCGNLMRTPDETAGRKGRCPTCQLKVQIPANSVASASSESPIRRTAGGSEPIRFDCGSCGKTLSIAAANAGKKGKCPHCGELMSIPLSSSSTTGAPTQRPATESRWKGTPKQRTADPSKPQPSLIKAGGEKIEFHCSSCREVVRVGVAAAGKKGQCPRCKTVIQIPRPSTTAPRPSQSNPTASTAQPTPPADRSPAAAGLTQLDEGALSPLEPLDFSPLTPVDAGVVAGDPFGMNSVDSSNPFANNSTAYSVPTRAVVTPAKPSRSVRSGAEIATMICGGILVFYAVAQMIVVTLSLFMQTPATLGAMGRMREAGEDPAFATGFVVGQILMVAVTGLAMLTILAGGIQMMRFKVWGLCLAACILTMMPCNCFCVLGLPIGIWGTIMLSLAPVRSAFR